MHGFWALRMCMRSSDNSFICRFLPLIALDDTNVGLGPAWPAADGGASSAGLADRVCLAGGGPSRAVSDLRAAARVHERDPARGCATAGAG
jgi:hypothetical protein